MAYYDSNPPVYYDSGVRYLAEGILAPIKQKPMKKIKLAPSQFDDEPFETFCENVVAATEHDPDLAKIVDKIMAVKTTVANYHTARLAMEEKRQIATTFENAFLEVRDELEVNIVSLANALEGEVKGNPTAIKNAAFSLVAEKQAVGQVAAPPNLTVKAGALEGTLKLRWKRVRGARTYIVQMATDANGPWKQVGVSIKASFVAEGLTSGTKYWFRVQALGASGPSGWSGVEGFMAP